MATDVAPPLVDGRQPSRRDRRHLISALANRFCCGDDRWIILNMPEPHWWPKFCAALGREDLLEDARFGSIKSRFDNMPELIDTLDATFATKPLEAWGRIFDDNGLIWGPAATLAELADDPQAAAAGLFPDVARPDGSAVRTVAIPWQIAGADVAPRGPAPAVGQHTVEVLLGAGLTEGEVAALAGAGVIAGPGATDSD